MRCFWRGHACRPAMMVFFLAVFLTACGSGSASTTGATPTLAAKQVLTFPNIGVSDVNTIDPTIEPDVSSKVVISMLYSGLLKTDKDLNIVPDQANWKISTDNKVYTFTLSPDVVFSDGTAVTAQSYIYTWTRVISSSPSSDSDLAALFEKIVVGASDVSSGKAHTVSGLKALDPHTLQVSLTQPAPYFLAMLTNALFFPLNQSIVNTYDQHWPPRVAEGVVGTGPFMLQTWERNVKMIFVPNPHYYGKKIGLTAVNMFFVSDPATALKAYRAGQYDLAWGLTAADQLTDKGTPGFLRAPLLQTDALFFDTTEPPFDNTSMRQAFAYATDKASLTHTVFKDSVVAAHTILPPGMPGYQSDYAGIAFDGKKAQDLLQAAYPDASQIPTITFSYPTSQVSSEEAAALQLMWKTALHIQVVLHPLDITAYLDEMQKNQVQFGFIQWSADFPDPYDGLTEYLFSTSDNNIGKWSNPEFDQTVTLADTLSGEARLALYNKAEQIAISDVGWLPLDHQQLAAVISPWVHGVTLNSNGLFFADWSAVSIAQH
ncbi:MAG TPA: peptide ABC transporter substrate-binding protein [Ktedonosporobacter sp.]|nr:peptide ABC transporter substrate-binding protein [Ktedonosporobacter sp.]